MLPATVAHQGHTSSCDTHQGSTSSWLNQPGLLLQTALPSSRTLSVTYTRAMLALAGVKLIFFSMVGMGLYLGFEINTAMVRCRRMDCKQPCP